MFPLSDTVITAMDAIGIVYSEKNRILNMIQRPWWGLSFCIDGKITYTHRGVDYISDREHAIILPKGASYRLFGSESGRFPLVNFQCQKLSLDAPLVIPLRNPEVYLKDYEMLENALLLQHAHAKAMSILYDIFHRLSNEQTGNAILLPALEYLENHFTDPDLSNPLLAQKCGISEVYFRQQFGKLFGVSPKQYVIDLRLRKAKQLLTNTDLAIEEIGILCGFPNPYHFSRTFKNATGMTPSAYRRQNKTFIV